MSQDAPSRSSGPQDAPQEKALRYAVLRLATLLREYQPKLKPILTNIYEMARGEIHSQQLTQLIQSLGHSQSLPSPSHGKASSPKQDPALSTEKELYELHALLDKLLTQLPQQKTRQALQDKLAQTPANNFETMNQILHSAIKALEGSEAQAPAISHSLFFFVQEFLQHLQSIKTLNKKISLFEKELYTMPPARAKQWARDFAHAIYSEITRINRHHDDLRNLVSSIEEQLTLFEQRIQESAADNNERHQDSARLESTVNQDVDSLHNEIQSMGPTQELEQMIKNRLHNIQKQLTDYRKREEERVRRAESRVQEINETVHSLQRKTEKLQKQNQQQTELLHKDTLTKINNRFAYEQYLSQHFAQWQKKGHTLHFCIWDIDYFKEINDTHGHKAGDQALKKIALLLKGELSQSEFLARIGGEEFVLFVFGQTDRDIQRFTEQIRRKIDESRFAIGEKNLHITISGGVARLHPKDTPDALYSRADKALYRSKEEGRNRVSLAWQQDNP